MLWYLPCISFTWLHLNTYIWRIRYNETKLASMRKMERRTLFVMTKLYLVRCKRCILVAYYNSSPITQCFWYNIDISNLRVGSFFAGFNCCHLYLFRYADRTQLRSLVSTLVYKYPKLASRFAASNPMWVCIEVNDDTVRHFWWVILSSHNALPIIYFIRQTIVE